MLESVRKDIEGVFGILKQRFHFLKQFNRMHSQKDIDNSFVTCCILHNMLLKAREWVLGARVGIASQWFDKV
jgi:hypothetical protein